MPRHDDRAAFAVAIDLLRSASHRNCAAQVKIEQIRNCAAMRLFCGAIRKIRDQIFSAEFPWWIMSRKNHGKNEHKYGLAYKTKASTDANTRPQWPFIEDASNNAVRVRAEGALPWPSRLHPSCAVFCVCCLLSCFWWSWSLFGQTLYCGFCQTLCICTDHDCSESVTWLCLQCSERQSSHTKF